MLRAAACAAVLAIVPPQSDAQTVRLNLGDRSIHGKPLAWSEQSVLLLQGDGQIVEIPPHKVQAYDLASPTFRADPAGQIRGELLREFGTRFDVTGTGHYLVVHPAGQRRQWADRFEQLYRSMHHYFVVRGFAIERPDFPLVAVVFPTRDEFLQYARLNKIKGVTANTLGFYHPMSNRILLFDITSGDPDREDWYVNAETILHEAAHQTAFNLKIHARLAPTPVWVVEGLGTMFEAPGVWNGTVHRHQKDRINTYQLAMFRKYRPRIDTLQVLTQQIQSDQLFDHQFELAYAHAWALSFFLTEHEPAKYTAYLKRLSALSPTEDYPAPRRLADFTAAFGSNLQLLDARLMRFLDAL